MARLVCRLAARDYATEALLGANRFSGVAGEEPIALATPVAIRKATPIPATDASRPVNRRRDRTLRPTITPQARPAIAKQAPKIVTSSRPTPERRAVAELSVTALLRRAP
jgi:hypothetical protein